MRCPVCRTVEEGVWRTFPTRAPRSRRAGALVLQEYVQGPAVRMPPSGIYWSLDQGWFSGSLSLGNGGPIRHPYSFQYRRRETTHMMMGSVNGSGWASASSHVTSITHLRLGVNRRPNSGYSFQGNVGPNEHYDPLPQGVNSIQPVGLEAPDVALLGEPIFNNSAGSLFGPLAGAAPVGQSMNSPSPAVRPMMRAAINRSSSRGLLPAERTAFQSEGSGTVNIPLPYIGEVVLALSAAVQPGDGVIDGSEDIRSDGEESAEDLSE
ncbi:uncharacterized protein LOC115751743 isoform X2 [Rhodamnia argentea]|uniref:Uncharacterized protein LOC115751743 isoform X2 n=1 Tax=Rhodamnia argentea TaxID=178133 RepID=A0ABM3GUN8_9MYRT|nr:uncharacterized protein LOC115751743 isoform X2 [Rhodamnia argentea]